MAAIEIKSSVKCFSGTLIRWVFLKINDSKIINQEKNILLLYRFAHLSKETKTSMTCAVYLPNENNSIKKFPSLMYLSGLTCNDENVCQKAGAFKALSDLEIGFIAPDTSPRGAGLWYIEYTQFMH